MRFAACLILLLIIEAMGPRAPLHKIKETSNI